MSVNPIYYSEDVKLITGIEFSIYTNKDVKKYSHITEDLGITLAESYENYEPKEGGLVDLRLGTCDIYLKCSTCGENTISCPGHFGHTELITPVFHYGFLKHLRDVLQCICLKCSNILINKSNTLIKRLLSKTLKSRFKDIKSLSKKVITCNTCGIIVPKIKKDPKEDNGSIKILLETPNNGTVVSYTDSNNKIYENANAKKNKEILSAADCFNILKNISDEDSILLGFNPKIQRPEDLIISVFPIAPVIIRPSKKIDFMTAATMEDGLTQKISDIIKFNNRVKKQLERDAQNVDQIQLAYKDDLYYTLLQLHVALYYENNSINLPRSEFKIGGKNIKSISERIKGKMGRVRSNLMGKRVEFSARTVITPDPYIDSDKLRVPKRIAMELTIPEEVTVQNIEKLSRLVNNGRTKYPGANFIIRSTFIDGNQDMQIVDLKYRKKEIILKMGDIVERHMINGDFILFNRQPTLHKPSMMGHMVRVIDNYDINSFGLNVSVCKPYNADFDGDEMNLHLGQSIVARNEIEFIANVKYQIISAKNSSPIIGCQQDTLSGAYMLSIRKNKIKGIDAANILCNTTCGFKYDIDITKDYTGNELFSFILQKHLNILKKNDEKIICEIVNGKFIKGVLNKSLLSFSKNSIIHFVWNKYGAEKTRAFIDDTQRLILNYLLQAGQTIGFKDVIIDDITNNEIQTLINTELLQSLYDLTQYENNGEYYDNDQIDAKLSESLNVIQANIGQILIKKLDDDNFFSIAVKSGARGDLTNIAQVSGVIGQQIISGNRLKKNNDRTLIYYHKFDNTPEARGFIKSSYLTGLTGAEFFINASAGREGLIDTAIKTAQTGYIQCQLVKGLEDITIRYDNTNRNSKNIIIQLLYGGNGISQTVQTETVSTMLKMDNAQIKNNFVLTPSEIEQISKKIKIDHKELVKFNDIFYTTLKKYRDEIRCIQLRVTMNYKNYKDEFMLPININRIIQDYTKSKTHIELKPQYIIEEIDNFLYNQENRLLICVNKNDKYMKNDEINIKFLLKAILYEYLCPKKCIFDYGLSKVEFDKLMLEVCNNFMRAIIQPGEMVGVIAAQSIGEPTSQLSVSKDSTIKIIKCFNGSLELISNEIGIFCDEIIKNNEKLTYKLKNHINSIETDITKLNCEYFILGVDKFEKTRWNKISHISRHPPNGDMITVTTKSGRTANTTLSHSHLIRKNQSVEPIKGLDLKLGMRIPISKMIENIYYVNNLNISGTDYILDYLFGWFIGLYISKGFNINNNIYLINIPIIFIDNIKSFINKINGHIVLIKKSYYDSNILQIEINSPILIEIINKYLNKQNIPEFSFISPNTFKSGLLQSYFDCNVDESFQLNTDCFNIINDISVLLNYFGIFSIIIKNDFNNKNYTLKIMDKFLNTYKKSIGTILLSEKLDNIIIFNKNINTDTNGIDKINEIRKIMINCYEKLDICEVDCFIDINYNGIDRENIIKFVNNLEKNHNIFIVDKEIKILKQAINSDVIWDEIIDIKIYSPNPDEYVYDFTVPGNETFMINDGMIVHNTLNTKHFAGSATKGSANMGVSRIQELLHYSKNIKTPSMTIYFIDSYKNDIDMINKIKSNFMYLTIRSLLSNIEIYYDIETNDGLNLLLKNDNVDNPFFVNNNQSDLSLLPFVFRFKLDTEKLISKEITLLDIKIKFISYWNKYYTNLKNLKKNDKSVISKINKCVILSNSEEDQDHYIHIRFSMYKFSYEIITAFLKITCDDIILKGIENINNIDIQEERFIDIDKSTGGIVIKNEKLAYTSGINFEKIKYIKGIDINRSTCNDINTIFRFYGIEAARQMLIYEFNAVYKESNINITHLSILIDQMCYLGEIISMDRHGLNKIESAPISKVSFEQQMDHFVNAAIFNESDPIKSVSSRIAIGRVFQGGTGAFNLLLDTELIYNSEYTNNVISRITFIPLEEEASMKDIIKHEINKISCFIPYKK